MTRALGPALLVRGAGFSKVLSFGSFIDVLIYGVIVGVTHALRYYEESRARERQAAELPASLAEARLAGLRAQLNPHVLFNTLNAVSVLAMKGDQAAVVRVVGLLSEILRSCLDEARGQEGSLAEELRAGRELPRDSTHPLSRIASPSTSMRDARHARRARTHARAAAAGRGRGDARHLERCPDRAHRHPRPPRRGGCTCRSRIRVRGSAAPGIADAASASRTSAPGLQQMYGDDQRLSTGCVAPGRGGRRARVAPPRSDEPVHPCLDRGRRAARARRDAPAAAAAVPDVEVVGEAGDGVAAVRAIDTAAARTSCCSTSRCRASAASTSSSRASSPPPAAHRLRHRLRRVHAPRLPGARVRLPAEAGENRGRLADALARVRADLARGAAARERVMDVVDDVRLGTAGGGPAERPAATPRGSPCAIAIGTSWSAWRTSTGSTPRPITCASRPAAMASCCG